MNSYKTTERLKKFAVVPGYTQEWSRLAAFASDELGAELAASLESATDAQRRLIVSAACEGPSRDTIYGVGGWITDDAQDYIRFVLIVADTAVRVMKVEKSEWDRKDLLRALRHCYETVGRAGDSPTDEYRNLCKATLVCYAANGPWQGFNDDAPYLAEHFDALAPYIEFLIRSGDTSNGQLNMLLTTQPVLPLSQGMV
jgi:hypothetical protein